MNIAAAAASSPLLRKQKRLGPAPIASMEDTTSEDKEKMEQQNNHSLQRWSHEKSSFDSSRGSPTKAFDCPAALAPATPRIDISRASSHSSHHDSRDSSPENVFEQVGTGTLQDSGVLGFREEDTLDLRNSTEELLFMEPEKGNREKEKPITQIAYGSCPSQRFSPTMWKLDEQITPSGQQQQQQYQQQQLHNRKDSASSEVVAFLSISGRTSRLSSVGSQGSANSKLSATSAVSGISRSPSPHKMLLETSFCGVKPLLSYPEGSIVGGSLEPSTEMMLEQVILSRKKDPTEAVLAEGIQLQPLGTPADGDRQHVRREPASQNLPKAPVPPARGVRAGEPLEEPAAGGGGHTRRKSDCGTGTTTNLEVQHLKVSQTSRSVGNKRHIPPRDLKNSIVGVMPSGTEYIRIKLKPDHCYTDNGIADNERVVELSKENGGQELPASGGSQRTRTSSITRFASPGNQQQQPQNQSRKKRTSTTSNESGAVGPQSDNHSVSANSTPSKQKLVLKMFKSKRDSKSKSPSPMGSAADGIGGGGGDHYSAASNIGSARSPGGTTGLRYYDAPLDGQSIHIPLHTPPEERRHGSFRSAIEVPSSPFAERETAGRKAGATVSVSASTTPTEHTMSHRQKYTSTSSSAPKQQQQQQRIANMTVTIHDRPKPMPPLKCYRIDNPDGSIIIPLKSPVEDKEPTSHNWENVIGELSQRIEKQASEDGGADVELVGSNQPNCKKQIGSTSHRPASLLYHEVDPSARSSRNDKQLVAGPSGPPPPPPPPPPTTAAGTEARSKSQRSELAAMAAKKATTTTTTTTAELHEQSMSLVRQKQQAMFQMRVGSGSEEQIFSTALKDQYPKGGQLPGSDCSTQSADGLPHRKRAGDGAPVVDYGSASGVVDGDVVQRKLFAGNCSDHPSDLVTADSVTTSSSSPQQVMMAQGALLMKELHEHQKQYQQRQKQQQKLQQQQQQQQQQHVAPSSPPQQPQKQEEYEPEPEHEQQRAHGPAASSTDGAAFGSRSSSSGECISSDAKHHHQHHHHHHQHHHQYQHHLHNHRPKHHKQSDRRTSSTERAAATGNTADDTAGLSSESEKDSEIESTSTTTAVGPAATAAEATSASGDRHALRPNMLAIEDHESAGLVFQESFDDELPYIPTTLPEEKPVGLKLVPVKERSQIDMKTYPLERPRSTTPIHPGALEKYCDQSIITPGTRGMTTGVEGAPGDRTFSSQLGGSHTTSGSAGEKLRICLPAKKSIEHSGGGGGSGSGGPAIAGGVMRMFEHRSSLGAITMTTTTAGVGGGGASTGTCIATSGSGRAGGRQYRSTSTTLPATMFSSASSSKSRGIVQLDRATPPPPLPPRKVSAPSPPQTTGYKWVDVEAIPEMRKAPKRITAIPQKESHSSHSTGVPALDRQDTETDGQVYNYVNPEDCQCECHEHERAATGATGPTSLEQQHALADMMALSADLPDDCRPPLRSSSSSSTAAAPSSTPLAIDHHTDQHPIGRRMDQGSVGFASTNDL